MSFVRLKVKASVGGGVPDWAIGAGVGAARAEEAMRAMVERMVDAFILIVGLGCVGWFESGWFVDRVSVARRQEI